MDVVKMKDKINKKERILDESGMLMRTHTKIKGTKNH